MRSEEQTLTYIIKSYSPSICNNLGAGERNRGCGIIRERHLVN